MTAKVEIYTRAWCGYCTRAKALLDAKQVAYTEYDVTMGGADKQRMLERKPDARTLPQIFINDAPVGGCDDLHALDRSGQLDALLAR